MLAMVGCWRGRMRCPSGSFDRGRDGDEGGDGKFMDFMDFMDL
jgi:hypothetical protein